MISHTPGRLVSNDDLDRQAQEAAAKAEADHAAEQARLPRWENVPPAMRALSQWCYYTERKFPYSLHAGQTDWKPYQAKPCPPHAPGDMVRMGCALRGAARQQVSDRPRPHSR